MKLLTPLRVSAVLAAVLALSLAPGTFAQSCPETCIESPNPPHCSSNPTGSFGGSTGDGGGSGSYDLALGTARAGSSNFGWARVEASDEYVITGPPNGTPVAITARLVLSGFVRRGCHYIDGYAYDCTYAGLGSSIADSAGSSSREYWSPDGTTGLSVSHPLDLPLTKNVGQPFRLDWAVRAGSGRPSSNLQPGADGTVTLSFQVPPGVTISSCSGYVGDVVGARPGSWGALKLRYR